MGSGESEKRMRILITYNPPSAKMAMRAAFCLLGRKRPSRDGIGMANIARSVAI